MMTDRRIGAPAPAERTGFSLIEVALALMVAASGLLAAFSLFPAALRQSVESHSYMVESTFASSALETIAANVRQIDDVAVWNDPEEWFKKATSTGFSSNLKLWKAADLRDGFEDGKQKVGPFHLSTLQVAETFTEKKTDSIREVFYAGREEESLSATVPDGSKIVEPPQWILRLHAIKRPARSNGEVQANTRLPTRYLVTIVSTPEASPSRYIENASYSQEFVFIRRP